MDRGHFWRRSPRASAAADEPAEIEVADLTQALSAPNWLRDAGVTAWLLVGITLFLVGSVWVLSLTHTIVAPVIAATVVAAVASPLVSWLQHHRVARGLGAALVLLGILAVGIGMFVAVFAGITSQSGDVSHELSGAKDTIEGWLDGHRRRPRAAADAKQEASSSTSDAFNALVHGLGSGIKALSSLVFFCALTVLSLFFLLKDGPTIRRWVERHLDVPEPVARTISRRVLQSLRGYFFGVTIVAAFNAVVVSLGALVLGVPLVGTIAAVTFIGAYIPYLGAWSAGAFSVLIALVARGRRQRRGWRCSSCSRTGSSSSSSSRSPTGPRSGSTRWRSSIVTIAGGALFGAVGLILAAPVTSAITRISADLSRARADQEEPGAGAPAPGAAPP